MAVHKDRMAGCSGAGRSLISPGRTARSRKKAFVLFARLACAPVMMPSHSFAQDAAPSALSETYGNWVIQCALVQNQEQGGTAAKPRSTCQLSQELRQDKTGQRVLLIVFNRNGKDKPPLSGTVIAPFGLDLQAGLSLLIKEDVYVKTSYKTCLPQGCVAPIAANGEFEEALRANEKLSVAMTASDTGQPVKLDVSLKGFAQGLDRLAALSARDE
ncbi:invasion associated locus B family protein [Mesorhizobium sp. M1406]|uniref:invasion associated locus B family protein n=1 Tax=Mesorhizobium sp. M1406 TaxID=2957099 RepID=UPI00333B3FDD